MMRIPPSTLLVCLIFPLAGSAAASVERPIVEARHVATNPIDNRHFIAVRQYTVAPGIGRRIDVEPPAFANDTAPPRQLPRRGTPYSPTVPAFRP